MAVGRVVDQRRAPAGLADVQEAMGADLEFGRLPAGVGVGRAEDVAELGLRRAAVGAHVDREGGLEELLAFVPVDLGLEVEAPGALSLAGPEIVVAHLALHAARIDPIATRNDPLLKNFVEDRFVEGFSLPRGE